MYANDMRIWWHTGSIDALAAAAYGCPLKQWNIFARLGSAHFLKREGFKDCSIKKSFTF